MMNIRASQMKALTEDFRKRNKEDVRKAVERDRATRFPGEDPAQRERFVAAAITECARIGVDDEASILRWCRLMERWGESFLSDPELPWAKRIGRWPASAGESIITALEAAAQRAS